MPRLPLVLLLILLAPPLHAREPGGFDLSGSWFGERWTGAGLVQHLSRREPDGRFTTRFRFFRGCREVGAEQQEGRWRVAGEVFETWIERVNDRPARPDGSAMVVRYAIEGLRGAMVSYHPEDGGRSHRAFQVPEGWAMPAPLGCEGRG